VTPQELPEPDELVARIERLERLATLAPKPEPWFVALWRTADLGHLLAFLMLLWTVEACVRRICDVCAR
jgi:hypothetical protein